MPVVLEEAPMIKKGLTAAAVVLALTWAVTRHLELALAGFNLLHANHLEFAAPQATEVPRVGLRGERHPGQREGGKQVATCRVHVERVPRPGAFLCELLPRADRARDGLFPGLDEPAVVRVVQREIRRVLCAVVMQISVLRDEDGARRSIGKKAAYIVVHGLGSLQPCGIVRLCIGQRIGP